MRVSISEVADQKAALKELAKLVEKSTVDPLVRNAALAITADCDARDDECEIHAIFNAVKHGDDRVKGLEKGLKYMSDPRWADFFSSPARTLRQLADGFNGGDCLPADTLLLGAGYKPFKIGEAKVGDLVMGDGKWVHITSVMDKGLQPLLEFKLNNGCTLRCTPDHKLFVVPRGKGAPAGDRGNATEVRASDVQLDDDLLTIQALPEGNEELSDGIVVRPHARVKSISSGGEEPTFDIEVEGHRFYLPETDLIVHNCDDHVALVTALLGSLGFVVGLRAWGKTKGEYTHVYGVVAIPKTDPRELMALDTTVDESEPGWEPPKGHVLTALLDGR